MSKTLAELEKERGFIAVDATAEELDKPVGDKKLIAMHLEGATVAVNHDHRVEFLKANGYEVTRENMVDSSLSAKPKKG